ncbi:hypothetical protein IAI10_10680 [Clostridium sp. 19966]|uniref:hypothetical protein n=1 Tax=Clostridium sp. 19966 TaxID=2768166 RepID=UPI0028DE1CBF|nr:hypothetical protein [Clostridium sp. 19966]MDT8717123.1 hypothetical protein [Clostridium sp. 19966]
MGEFGVSEGLINKKNVNEKGLWNPKYFLVISIIFSFVPAGVLYALNYGRMGDKKKKNYTLFSVIAGFLLLLVVSVFIPGNDSKYIGYAVNIFVASYFSRNQKELYASHILGGGKKASFALPIFLSIIICAIIVVPLIALTVYYGDIPDNKIQIHGSELYYTENIKQDDAKKFGEYLYNSQIIGDNDKASLKIDKIDNEYIFSVIIDQKYLNDKDVADQYQDLANLLSTDYFKNSKVKIQFCNERFKELKSFSSN